MFWNATTCQKRKIPGRKKAQNDNTAPESDAVYSSILAQGLFFFEFQAQPEGRMTQGYDTTTERKLWFSGAWGQGGAYQQAFAKLSKFALLATINPYKETMVYLLNFFSPIKPVIAV